MSVSVTVEAELDKEDSFLEIRNLVHKRASAGVSTYMQVEIEKWEARQAALNKKSKSAKKDK